MQLLSLLSMLAATLASVKAQDAPVPPKMTLLYSMVAELGDRFSLGPVPNGKERFVIPIVGGHFKGPRLSGQYWLDSSESKFAKSVHRQSLEPRRRLVACRFTWQCAARYEIQHPD
jgi:hypothetical protein